MSRWNLIPKIVVGLLLLSLSYSIAWSEDNHLSMTIELGKDGVVVYHSGEKSLLFREVYQFASDQLKASESKPNYHIIFRDDVPFSNVINVRKTLQAIGYVDVRCFVFSREKRYMTEIVFAKGYPYSTEPNP